MGDDTYPRFRAAAVQAAPVFLNREATISRLAEWVAKARDAGADLVVFGESFVPAFPIWNMLYAPIDQHAFISACSSTQWKFPDRRSSNSER
jgi:nitrilase